MKILVIDDEPLARARLMRMLWEIPGAEVVGEAESGQGALQLISAVRPDLLLLDVEMPGIDGLQLAEMPGMPPIIFTTAHPKFAADAFDLDAVDYLVKPVRKERLEKALARVERRLKAPAEVHRLTVHTVQGVRFVDPRTVTAFRALDKYTEFKVEGEELLVRESLDLLEERLAELGFVRVHRAGLVRKDAVTGLEKKADGLVARLTDGTTVEVSRRQVAEVKRALGLKQ